MNPKLLLLMSLLSLLGCGKKAAPEYPADTLTTRDGTQITITFFRHASLSIEVGGKYVYVDPVSGGRVLLLKREDLRSSLFCQPFV